MLNIRMLNSNTQQSQMFLYLGISLSKQMTTKSLLSLAHQVVERLHQFLCSSAFTIQQMAKSFIMEKTLMTLILHGTTKLKSQLCLKSRCYSQKQSKITFFMDLTPLNFQKKKSKPDWILHASRHIVKHSQKTKINSPKVSRQKLGKRACASLVDKNREQPLLVLLCVNQEFSCLMRQQVLQTLRVNMKSRKLSMN